MRRRYGILKNFSILTFDLLSFGTVANGKQPNWRHFWYLKQQTGVSVENRIARFIEIHWNFVVSEGCGADERLKLPKKLHKLRLLQVHYYIHFKYLEPLNSGTNKNAKLIKEMQSCQYNPKKYNLGSIGWTRCLPLISLAFSSISGSK